MPHSEHCFIDEPSLSVGTVSFYVPFDSVERWWPNGLGNQVLYPIQISFRDDDNLDSSTLERKVGFRWEMKGF